MHDIVPVVIHGLNDDLNRIVLVAFSGCSQRQILIGIALKQQRQPVEGLRGTLVQLRHRSGAEVAEYGGVWLRM